MRIRGLTLGGHLLPWEKQGLIEYLEIRFEWARRASIPARKNRACSGTSALTAPRQTREIKHLPERLEPPQPQSNVGSNS
ncbi:MAG: hypothetical protein WBC51_16640 [Vicinamibacterales bacterium]